MSTLSCTSHTYHAFGMRIESEIPLSELIAAEGAAPAAPTLSVGYASLEALWSETPRVNEYWAAQDGLALVRVPDTAIFAMRNGNAVLISPLPGADADKLRLYVLGTCMGVILMQNRMLPLHGSAVAMNGRAYAVLGASGAGKSTLASHLLEQGFELLSDDLIAVVLGEKNVPYVMPAYPQQKIWRESIRLLGKSEAGLKPLFDREAKFAVPAASRFCNRPLPLAGVFELVKTDNKAALRPIERLEKCHTLLQHTYRSFMLQRLGLMEWHFGTVTRFAGSLPMHRLHRPRNGNSLTELTALLFHTMEKENE